jgi:hypothetical protein
MPCRRVATPSPPFHDMASCAYQLMETEDFRMAVSRCNCVCMRVELAFSVQHTLQKDCTKNLKQAFPENKLRDLFSIFTFMYLYISTIGPQTQYSKIGRHKSVIAHECRNWERRRAVSYLGIFASNFRCSVCLATLCTIAHPNQTKFFKFFIIANTFSNVTKS